MTCCCWAAPGRTTPLRGDFRGNIHSILLEAGVPCLVMPDDKARAVAVPRAHPAGMERRQGVLPGHARGNALSPPGR